MLYQRTHHICLSVCVFVYPFNCLFLVVFLILLPEMVNRDEYIHMHLSFVTYLRMSLLITHMFICIKHRPML